MDPKHYQDEIFEIKGYSIHAKSKAGVVTKDNIESEDQALLFIKEKLKDKTIGVYDRQNKKAIVAPYKSLKPSKEKDDCSLFMKGKKVIVPKHIIYPKKSPKKGESIDSIEDKPVIENIYYIQDLDIQPMSHYDGYHHIMNFYPESSVKLKEFTLRR